MTDSATHIIRLWGKKTHAAYDNGSDDMPRWVTLCGKVNDMVVSSKAIAKSAPPTCGTCIRIMKKREAEGSESQHAQ